MIELPWPHRWLNPNARKHFRVTAPIKAKARSDAFYATRAADITQPLPFIGERLPVSVTFFPPDKRWRDDDNMIASFKSARDGIADALGVNDRCFACHYVFEEPVKGGKIVVEIGR